MVVLIAASDRDVAEERLPTCEALAKELKAIHDSEMWQAGAAVRSLRPENWEETKKAMKRKVSKKRKK